MTSIPTSTSNQVFLMFNRALSTLVLCVLALGGMGSALAQEFPNRPVRIVIGFPPGGGIDIMARIIAPKLSEALGQTVVVDNKPGAAGILGTNLVAKAPPDGYTLFLGTTGNISINPLFMPNLPFNIDKDLAPLMQVASVPFLIYAHPQFTAQNLGELVAYGKANPGKVNFYSSGNGGLPHLTGEMLNMLAGIKTVHVSYKGSAPGMNDLLGGQVQLGFDAVAIGLPHVKAGKLRVLASTGPKRLSILPDVPAANESVPGLEAVNWYGMMVLSGTPKEIIQKLQREIAKVINLPEIRDKLVAQGIDPAVSTPEEFAEFVKAESLKWGKVIRQADIKPN